jgi:hypothetical protein
MKTKTLAIILLAASAAPSIAGEDDLAGYIAGQAAHCWAKPESLRGISFSADFEVSFERDGHASEAHPVSVEPQGATYQALAADLSQAFTRCGPYVTEGMRDMRVTVSWPGSYGAVVTD